MNEIQRRTIEYLRREIFLHDAHVGSRDPSESKYEYKRFDVKESPETGQVFLLTEVGLKNDEGTMASILCRSSRHIAIGKKGGLTLLNARKTRGKKLDTKYVRGRRAVWYQTAYNPVGRGGSGGLFQSFHGAPPANLRQVQFVPPQGHLVKIGRLTEIRYTPEAPSQYEGTEFYHKSGDTGAKMLRSNCILCTDSTGKNLYIIKEKQGKYPYFSSRGIIG